MLAQQKFRKVPRLFLAALAIVVPSGVARRADVPAAGGYADGRHTGAKPGRVVRGPGWTGRSP